MNPEPTVIVRMEENTADDTGKKRTFPAAALFAAVLSCALILA